MEGSAQGRSTDLMEDWAFFLSSVTVCVWEQGRKAPGRGRWVYGGECREHPVIHRTQPGNERLCRGKHRWRRLLQCRANSTEIVGWCPFKDDLEGSDPFPFSCMLHGGAEREVGVQQPSLPGSSQCWDHLGTEQKSNPMCQEIQRDGQMPHAQREGVRWVRGWRQQVQHPGLHYPKGCPAQQRPGA